VHLQDDPQQYQHWRKYPPLCTAAVADVQLDLAPQALEWPLLLVLLLQQLLWLLPLTMDILD
jgi:hypothetical protein